MLQLVFVLLNIEVDLLTYHFYRTERGYIYRSEVAWGMLSTEQKELCLQMERDYALESRDMMQEGAYIGYEEPIMVFSSLEDAIAMMDAEDALQARMAEFDAYNAPSECWGLVMSKLEKELDLARARSIGYININHLEENFV